MKIKKKYIEDFFKEHIILHGIFRDSPSPDAARDLLHNYLTGLWRNFYRTEDAIKKSLQWDIEINALRAIRWIISVRSEKLTGFSIVRLLWRLARRDYSDVPADLAPGFFEELHHLFRAITGEAETYQDMKKPEFLSEHGRTAAEMRSDDLDGIAAEARKYISRYPDGLRKAVIRRREENKKHILKVMKGTEADWQDYRWHLKNVIKDADVLSKLVGLTPDEKKAVNLASGAHLPFGITPYYVSLMDRTTDRRNDHAIRAQVLPPLDYIHTMKAYRGDEEYHADFMQERDTSPIELITRRYPSIAIFKPYNTCSQICVYCQRNWEIREVLDPRASSPKGRVEAALKWFKEHKDVEEVLITGGDPFIMSTDRIRSILERFAEMKHIRRIRIGSRTPVVLPQRINVELADTIASFHIPGLREVAIITHFEHVYEVTPQAMGAVQMFRQRGLSVYNQAVFTIENSRKFELVALRRQLRLIGVDPYYTFQTKGKEETNLYRVPLARLMQEVKEEARVMPGLMRTDEPVYNVPRLGKNYIRAEQHHSLLTILTNGCRVYEYHPWEKNLSLTDTYVDTDVSIYHYLQRLKARGENIKDYRSIYYYY